MIVCTHPDCQTTAGCVCGNKLYDYAALEAQLAEAEARAARIEAETIERCAQVAKGAWLVADIGTIADADAQNELCEHIAAAIRAMKKEG